RYEYCRMGGTSADRCQSADVGGARGLTMLIIRNEELRLGRGGQPGAPDKIRRIFPPRRCRGTREGLRPTRGLSAIWPQRLSTIPRKPQPRSRKLRQSNSGRRLQARTASGYRGSLLQAPWG